MQYLQALPRHRLARAIRTMSVVRWHRGPTMIWPFNKLHRWVYRNPFNRTCKVCGRHEVFHGKTAALTKFEGWWEVFDDGEKALHNK
ncbi:hypothetical protein [Castellaniella sp.]|uniref:hypothetical protein n=1 Tax=Castellaniella sp. TaxID=1955812 RepID=UPI002AFFAA63|nr:hypothetical protein [Castellaniella sp.]